MTDIIFFSNHLRGPKGAAGARSWHQAKWLSKKWKIRIIIPGVDPVTAQKVTPETYAGLEQSNVEVVLIPIKSNDRSSLWARSLYYLSAVGFQLREGLKGERPKLVLCMGLPLTTLGAAWLCAVRQGAPLIVDVRDLPFETAKEIGYIKSTVLVTVLKACETFFLKRASAILTNSPYYVPVLEQRGIAKDKITLAPIGYDDFPTPDDHQIEGFRTKLKTNLSPGTKFVGLYSGTLGFAFPVDAILKCALALVGDRDIGFVILGDGQRLKEYQHFVDEYGLNVWLPGRVDKQMVAAACRVADYCIYPSHSGNFSGGILGNKIFDYLGAEKPVIYIGGKSAVRDLLQDLDCGLYSEPQQVNRIRDNIRRLMSDKKLALQLKQNTKKIFSRGFTAEASAKKLITLIEERISKSG